MFFSIIIPLYNRPQEIDQLLYTLVQQQHPYFEVLVIEDGSSIDAKKIVESYQDQLDVHYFFEKNQGQGFARNIGFKKAKGDYFIIFDSDCLIPVNYLQIVENHLKKKWLDVFGGPDAAHESFTFFQKAINYSMTSFLTTGGIRGNKRHIGQFYPRSFNMGLSRLVWEKTGGFMLTRLGEDIEFSMRAQAMGFQIGLIAEAFVYHKRRTDWLQFYKQLHFFGRSRINLHKYSLGKIKWVHYLPTLFVFFIACALVFNFFNLFFAEICNLFLAVYVLSLFFHAWSKTGSVRVAFLSIFTAFLQLIAYGIGFLQDLLKRIIFKID